MDKFYEWAGLLQKEFRDMQNRQIFLESNLLINSLSPTNAPISSPIPIINSLSPTNAPISSPIH
jgi:hypothetical protein